MLRRLSFGNDGPMPSQKPAPCSIRGRFGANAAQLRIGRRLTQEQMAEKVGLSTRYWQSVEAGEYCPPIATIVRVKKALKCTWDGLFKGCE